MGRPRTNPQDVLICSATAVVNVDGQEILIKEGVTRARRGSRIVELWPTHWKPIDVHFDVEQATAAPGERPPRAAGGDTSCDTRRAGPLLCGRA